MVSDPSLALIDELLAEKKRLDDQLDEALARYAEVEEYLNHRMKDASPDERMALMAERSRIEEELGIVAIVERLDRIRDQLAVVQA